MKIFLRTTGAQSLAARLLLPALVSFAIAASAQPELPDVKSSPKGGTRASMDAELLLRMEPSRPLNPPSTLMPPPEPVPGRIAQRLHSIAGKDPSASAPAIPRALIMSFSETNLAVLRELEHDLAVMHRVLVKTMPNSETTAMGITVWGSPSDPAGFPIMYFEDYGAVFILRTPLALVVPHHAKEPGHPARQNDSEWDRARQEMFGPPAGSTGRALSMHSAGAGHHPEQIERLTTNLLQALKNASRIRHIRSEDWLSVAVIGPGVQQSSVIHGGTVPSRALRVPEPGPGVVEPVIVPSPRAPQPVPPVIYSPGISSVSGTQGRSQLLLRVKKSDVDAFASGEMEFEQFRDKVAIAMSVAAATGIRPMTARVRLLVKDPAGLSDFSWIVSERILRKVFDEFSPRELRRLQDHPDEELSPARRTLLWKQFSEAIRVYPVSGSPLVELRFTHPDIAPAGAAELLGKAAQHYARLWPERLELPDPVDQPSRFD
jgi:hypothetical protein